MTSTYNGWAKISVTTTMYVEDMGRPVSSRCTPIPAHRDDVVAARRLGRTRWTDRLDRLIRSGVARLPSGPNERVRSPAASRTVFAVSMVARRAASRHLQPAIPPQPLGRKSNRDALCS